MDLKVGDLVMVGGAASAEDRAKNAGRFRTVVGFVHAGRVFYYKNGTVGERAYDSAILDGDMFNELLSGPNVGLWIEVPYKTLAYLVKINPGNADDETLTWVGLPSAFSEGAGRSNKQTQPDKESA